MNIKTFMDGDKRLVIILEGDNIPTEKDLLMGLLSKVTNDEVEQLPEAEAVPVPFKEAEPIYVETSFFTGSLDDAFDKVDCMSKELELLKALNGNAEVYLRHKFSKMDGSAYADKLTAVQKTKFFETYGPFLPDALVKAADVAGVIDYYKAEN